MIDRLHSLLRAALYVAAVLLLPGALIGAPILWWINHRNRNTPGRPTHRGARARGAACWSARQSDRDDPDPGRHPGAIRDFRWQHSLDL
jgi:hypothetical protein